MVPVECVVRGYITGSGWKDYQATGAVCGIDLPEGLRESEQLPEPIFTPATKAEVGDHDENVDFDRAAEIVGDRPLLEELRRLSIEIYTHAAEHARERGIILADTKFEFGRRPDGDDRAGRRGAHPGLLALLARRRLRARARASRASTSSTCATGPAGRAGTRRRPRPPLPDDVIARTRELYVDAYERITGEPFSAWLERSGGEGPRPHPPQGGHPRPAGPGRGARAARARLRGRGERAHRADGGAGGGRHRRGCTRCASACWPIR